MPYPIDETHDPARTSWVSGAEGHADFPVQNLPYGIFSPDSGKPRPGVAIGDFVLDLSAIAALLPPAAAECLKGTTLNALFALPAAERAALRQRLSALLSDPANRSAVEPALFPAEEGADHRTGDPTLGSVASSAFGILPNKARSAGPNAHFHSTNR